MLKDQEILDAVPTNSSFDERTKWLWFGRFIEQAVIDKLSKQSAPVSDGLPEQWRLAGPGQIKSGDVIIMTTAGRRICKTAKEVLHAGTGAEEVIYNRKKNHYFITSMVLDGTSNHKDVFIIPG